MLRGPHRPKSRFITHDRDSGGWINPQTLWHLRSNKYMENSVLVYVLRSLIPKPLEICTMQALGGLLPVR